MLDFSNIEPDNTVNDTSLDNTDDGLGFSAELNINRYFGFELGIFSIRRRYITNSGNASLVEDAKRAHIPGLFRVWLWDNVSLGAGPFASIRTDGVRSAETGNAEELDTQASDSIEWGLEFAGTLNIAYGDRSGIFLEGRWSEPFNQRSDVEINQFSAITGIKVEVDL